MNKCSALIWLACIFALLMAEHVVAAPVTWDFVANSCSTFSGTGCDPKQQYPALIATLTLTGPDSSGSAVWAGTGPPAYAGDDFSLDFSSRYAPLTQTFAGNPTPFGECEGPRQICEFDLSWSETAGVLDAVDVLVNGFNDSLGEVGAPGGTFGLRGQADRHGRHVLRCLRTGPRDQSVQRLQSRSVQHLRLLGECFVAVGTGTGQLGLTGERVWVVGPYRPAQGMHAT